MRLDRLLAIINLLLSRDRASAPDLSRRFEVSVRTIYRDIEAINAAGIPVMAFPGNCGGFGIMENYRLDRQLFTFKDMVSTLSILKGVNLAIRDQQVAATIDKISSLIPREQLPDLQMQTAKMVVDIQPWGMSAEQQSKLACVQRALSENRLLRFTYWNSSGQKNQRVVEPMTLLFKAYQWYLFGYCRLRRAFRLFRLTRMLRPRVLTRAFMRRSGNYQELIPADSAGGSLVKLRLKFAPGMRYRLADYFDADRLQSGKDGSWLTTLSFPENEWLYSFLLGFGDQVEIISPRHIRQALAGRLKKMLRRLEP